MSIPHPIPYQGSKRKLAPDILKYIPANTKRLVEPFAGSAAVSLAALNSNKVEKILLNDLNMPLICLWNEIIASPQRIASQYELLWYEQQGKERAYYDEVRQKFNQTQRAEYFLYLLARCVKASVRYNANGEFNQSPDNRRKGTQPATMQKHILGASHLLKNKTALTATDYREVLAGVQETDLVYLDPPYQGVSGKRDPRYLSSISFDDFVDALRDLNRLAVPYIVSYDGKSGTKSYGRILPVNLNLKRIELDAGRSSQATLLGRSQKTIESLYLSPGLVEKLGMRPRFRQQYSLHTWYV